MSNIRSYFKEKEKRTQEEFEGKIFRHKLSVFLLVFAVILIVIGAAVYLIIQWKNHIYTYYEVVSSQERDVINGTEDIRLGDVILTYSRDGAHCTDAKGKMIWNQTFQIQDPIISICQNVAAIAEYNGRNVYLFSDEQILGNFSTNMPIRNIAVSAAGIVTVVMADTEVTYYDIYSAKGEQLYEGQATMTSSGYPMALAMSPGGELLQISYVYLDAGIQKTNVAFYNLGDVGDSRTDFFVGVHVYDDLLVPYVQFMNNSTCFAVGDDQLMIYKGAQIPEEKFVFHYEDEVKSVYYNEKYIGLVFYSEEGSSLYKMNVYDVSGSQTGTYYFNVDYSDIFFGKDYFAAYNDAECTVVTLDGVVKFDGSFEKSVRRMIPLGSFYRFLVITDDSLETIQLK